MHERSHSRNKINSCYDIFYSLKTEKKPMTRYDKLLNPSTPKQTAPRIPANTFLFSFPFVSLPPTTSPSPPLRRGLYRALIRMGTVALPVLIAIAFPDFDRIIAFLGSGMCIAICVILPICYYFKILGHEIRLAERVFCWILLIVGGFCAVVGTVWTYLPPRLCGDC